MLSIEEKLNHVEAWSRSGKTRNAYAREHGIPTRSFANWCVKMQEPQGSHSLNREKMTRRSATERHTHIETWKRSGKSQSAYAREQGISATTFSTWVRNSRKKGQGNHFIEISTPEPIGNRSEMLESSITIEHRCGNRIAVGDNFNSGSILHKVRI